MKKMTIVVSLCLLLLLLVIDAQCQWTKNYDSQAQRKEASKDYYEVGNVASSNGQYDLAIIYYDSAIALYIGYPDYFIARGQMRDLEGDKVGALIDFESAIKIDPENQLAIFRRATIYHHQKQYAQAAKDFTYLINSDLEFETKAIIYKGGTYDENGQLMFSGIGTVGDMTADIYEARARTYEQLGFVTPTRMDFDKAIELNKHEPNYYVNRGLFRANQKDVVGAEADFRSALEINAYHRQALYNLSFLVDGEEKDEINKLLYGVGDFAMAYSKKAFEYYQKGDYQEALLAYDSSLLIKSDNANDLMNRGMVKAKLENYKAAIDDFESSLYTDNSLTRNFVLIGNAYHKMSNYKEAIAHYKQYLYAEKPEGVVCYNMGLSYREMDDKQEACKRFTQAYQLGERRAEKLMEEACF